GDDPCLGLARGCRHLSHGRDVDRACFRLQHSDRKFECSTIGSSTRYSRHAKSDSADRPTHRPGRMRKPMRQLVKKLSMQATANIYSSELDESGFEARPAEFRVISALDLTENVLRRCGIQRGMRVLELECGRGNASFSIARLVGPSGLVVGVDQSAESIDVAEKR